TRTSRAIGRSAPSIACATWACSRRSLSLAQSSSTARRSSAASRARAREPAQRDEALGRGADERRLAATKREARALGVGVAYAAERGGDVEDTGRRDV